MIDEAEALLRRASALGAIGRYQLEAALQSAHVHRRRTGHGQLGGGRAALRCAVRARRFAGGRDQSRARDRRDAAAPARRSSDAPTSPPMRGSREYQPYWAARADLLAKTGAHGEARRAYEIAIGLERDPAVRDFLQTSGGTFCRTRPYWRASVADFISPRPDARCSEHSRQDCPMSACGARCSSTVISVAAWDLWTMAASSA